MNSRFELYAGILFNLVSLNENLSIETFSKVSSCIYNSKTILQNLKNK